MGRRYILYPCHTFALQWLWVCPTQGCLSSIEISRRWFQSFTAFFVSGRYPNSDIQMYSLMRKKQIRKALKSETPANSMYALIPKNRREAFRRFASCFGFTEDDIKSILANEKRWFGHIDCAGRRPLLFGLLSSSAGHAMERIERILDWLVPIAVIVRVILLCL